MAEYVVPDLTLASTYASPAPLPDMGVQQNPVLDQLFSQNPVSTSVNDIVTAIQSQYQPIQVNTGEGPYGAARFIGQGSGVADAGQPVTGATIPSWFTPGQFDINAYSVTPQEELAQQIATGELYGGGSDVTQTGGTEGAYGSAYDAWGQTAPKGLTSLLNSMIPGAGLMVGAGQGYNQTNLGNQIGIGLSAYGGQPTGPSSPAVGALLGALGISTPSGKMAQALAQQYSDPQSLYGYMSVATDPAMLSIAESLMANASTPLSANDVGIIGAAISSQISQNVASGMSVGQAYAAAAQDLGSFSAGNAAALGVMASQQAVQSAINSGSDMSTLNPADIEAANDPIGGLIANLGLSGSEAAINAAEQAANQATSVDDAIAAATQAAAQQTANEQAAAQAAAEAQAAAQVQAAAEAAAAQQAAEQQAAYEAMMSQLAAEQAAQAAAEQAAAEAAAAQSSGSSDVGYSVTDSGWGTDYGGGYDSYGESPSSSSDSGSGGGGKIVCTAMNQAYGFGSFRNQIWLKYAADNLTKAHEVGYHTLFLPLVDLGYKKNIKPVRAVLEHIARHRTADLRAEMRNRKRDKLGRIYRAILEPVCYIVGKLKGY
jgi:hypothetical protein